MVEPLKILTKEVTLLGQDVQALQKLIENLINSSNDQAEVLGVDDVVKLTGYSKHTIYQYKNKGLIPFHKPMHGGRKLVFFRSEIEAWVRGKKPESSEEFCDRKESELLNQYKGRLN